MWGEIGTLVKERAWCEAAMRKCLTVIIEDMIFNDHYAQAGKWLRLEMQDAKLEPFPLAPPEHHDRPQVEAERA